MDSGFLASLGPGMTPMLVVALLLMPFFPVRLRVRLSRADRPRRRSGQCDDRAKPQRHRGQIKELEDKSGIQLVVATVKSLQGSDIETYANELFRFWKLGEAKKNNGVLLLVAPTEHKVRIEVGYGLEGTLTDALSSVIISSAMVPRFKANDYSGGIERGVDGIISVLTTDAAEWHQKAEVRVDRRQRRQFNVLFRSCSFVLILVHHLLSDPQRHGRPGRAAARGRGGPVFIPYGGCWGGGSGGGGGGGGFRRRLFRRRRFFGRRRRVGELVMQFSADDHEAVAAAIRAAEQRTSGQIVCVLARASVGLRPCADPVGERRSRCCRPGR